MKSPGFSAASLRERGLPARVAQHMPALLEGKCEAGSTALKPGVVFRIPGEPDLVVKLYRRRDGLEAKVRGNRAKQAVQAYLKIFPVSSPLPVFWDGLDHPNFDAVLVCEFADGPSFWKCWKGEELGPIQQLPQFLAQLYRSGALHGDLHGHNLIWTADAWTVIDLDGIRPILHGVRRRQIWERTWARLLFDMGGSADARPLFEEFLRCAELTWNPAESWQRVLALYDQVCAKRAKRGYQPGD